MGDQTPTMDDLNKLTTAIQAQKQAVQAIFKAKNFSAMPAVQQRLAQLDKELRLLRSRMVLSTDCLQRSSAQGPESSQTSLSQD